ncbi:MAG: hypothetical protein ACI35W_00370 [Anaeroplasmataceae bacterium]
MNYDREEILDVLDIIFEYNYPPTISNIMKDLCYTYEKVLGILDILSSYEIISYNDDVIEILKDYEYAILLF